MESLREIALAFDSESPAFDHYTAIVNEKERQLAVPNPAMKQLHARLTGRLHLIENLEGILTSSYGALNGGSIVTNAAQHVRNRHFYMLDLRDAYPSTSLPLLADVLRSADPELGSYEEILSFLLRFCRGRNGGLAVGAPASPKLFDLYCAHEIDIWMRDICTESTYTRYLDDLTISSKKPLAGIMRRRIREVIQAAGFAEHRRKSRIEDRMYQSPAKPLKVTGVVITRRGFLRPDPKLESEIRSFSARKSSALAPEELARLRGLAGYLMQFKEPEKEARPKGRRPADEPQEWKQNLIPGDLKRLQALIEGRFLKPKAKPVASPSPSHRFSPQFLKDLLKEVRIEDVVRDYVPGLRKWGREYHARCPFHHEKTRSFTVSPDKRFCHCFGCAWHGDAIDLVEQLGGLSFPDAVRLLCDKYAVDAKP
ncbi:MAG TPA: CHC2 zinc finger domain-containing protein [Candidatus Paceibacterota bacterium]|jgi:hypothetical protein